MPPRTILLMACALSFCVFLFGEDISTSQREKFRINKGWKFHYGDVPLPNVTSHHGVYVLTKAGNARAQCGLNYDDSSWQTVNIPHDFVIDGKFDKNESVSHGFLARPVSWYRRQFALSDSDRQKTVWLYFDSVCGVTNVWVNGQEMAYSNNGYIGFRINISDVAHYGDRPNTITVKTDAREPQGWWYEGGGIYRHVWLEKANPIHVAPFGVWVNPQKIKDNTWETKIETTIESELNKDATITITSKIFDPQGKVVAEKSDSVLAVSREQVAFNQTITVENPQLWDIDTPNLYKVFTTISQDNKVIDHNERSFGYRTIEFDSKKGVFLNGRSIQLKGVCMHQDHAGVGVAVPDKIQEFRIAKLKEMGANAYRCSHNPPATEILDACDRLGMLVMNENRFYNSAPMYLDHLKEQVLRDRNHPSVIMWSIFNEEPWQGDERGRKMAERMMHTIKKYDPTRPVTGAMNGGYNNQGAFAAMDILGINYALGSQDHAHRLFPNKYVFGSENVSHSATRGEFITDHKKYTFDNYDVHHVGWGTTIRTAWKHTDMRKWNGSMFIWTGFDYRGEPTPYSWPVISSYFGIFDTCGFPKDSYYLCQALWTTKPMAHVYPHWTHDNGMIGKDIKVGVFTNGDKAELILNGKSLGRHKVDKYNQLFVNVKYEPGTLVVKTYKDGKPHAENSVTTTTAPVAVGVETKFIDWDTKVAEVGNSDAFPIAIYATDAAGRRSPIANNKVTVEVLGGRVLGMGNGDPTSHEPDRSLSRSLFNGLASAIIEANDDAKIIEIKVTSPGLKPATIKIPTAQAKNIIKQYPTLGNDFVLVDWRMSEISPNRRNPNEEIADNDMNTWERILVGTGAQVQFENKKGFAVYRTEFTMPDDNFAWEMQFAEVVGKCELYLNGEKVFVKDDPKAGSMRTTLNYPPGSKVVVSAMIEADDKNAGLTKTVRLVQTKAQRRCGYNPKINNLNMVFAGEFRKDPTWQTIKMNKVVEARYIVLETVNSYGNTSFTHAAELRFIGENGDISTSEIKILYASSEEMQGDDGKIDNLFDGNINTFWHTKWQGHSPNHPHRVYVDLGAVHKISALKYHPRRGSDHGPLRKFKIYASKNKFDRQ